jgi:hypothetical protein
VGGKLSSFHAQAVWAVLDGDRGLLDPLVEKLLVALLSSNRAQWDAEDRARTTSDPVEIAELKASIDRLNAHRVQVVLEIDRALHEVLAPRPAAPPCTETPGSVCDRLSVLHLRRSYTEAASRRPGQSELRGRLAQVVAQASELRWAFDVMLNDVRAGRRAFTVHEPNKLYGRPGPGSGGRIGELATSAVARDPAEDVLAAGAGQVHVVEDCIVDLGAQAGEVGIGRQRPLGLAQQLP